MRAERLAGLRSGRPVHGARASSDACGSRGSSLASTRNGRQRANVGEELVAPHRGRGLDAPQPVPVHRRIAEIVRSSSGSERRVLNGERVESSFAVRGERTGA